MAEFTPGWGGYMGPSLTPEELKQLQVVKEGELLRSKAPGKDVVLRNMKQVGPGIKDVVGERIYPKGLMAPEAKVAAQGAGQAAGKGLLGRALGVVGGPIGMGAQAALTPGDLANPNEDPAWKEHYRQEPGWQYAQGVADRAVGAGMQYAQNMLKPKETVTVQEAPAQEQPNRVAEVQKQVETRASKMLEEGSLTRKSAAEAVVAADELKTGEKLPEKEKAARVKEETAAMRGMDKGELSKYLSLALAGIGLAASAVDDTAARNYGNAFQAEVERKRNIKAMQQKMEYEAAEKEKDRAIQQQKADATTADVVSKIENRENLNVVDMAKLELAKVAEQRKAAGQGARLSLEEQRLQHQMTTDAVRLGLLAEKNKILADKAAKADGPKGLTLSTKDATEQIKEYAKSQGFEIDDATAQAAGTQLQVVAKNAPVDLSQNPDGVFQKILSKYKTKTPETFFGFGGGNDAYALPGLLQGQ